jgi:hypothetical protein
LRHRCGEYRQAQLYLMSSEISFVKAFDRSEMLSPIEGKKPATKKAAKSESSTGEKSGKGLLVPIGGTAPFSRVMNSRGCAPPIRLVHAIAGQPSDRTTRESCQTTGLKRQNSLRCPRWANQNKPTLPDPYGNFF